MASIQLSSYLGGKKLAAIPVVSGSWKVTVESDVTVPGAIEFSVPAVDDWVPVGADHPLQGMGQRVWARVDQGSGWRTWGWYRLAKPSRDGSVINCTGQGLLREVERYRLTTSWQTVDTDTRAGVVKALLAGILPVVVSGIADEVLPVTTWEEDRLAAFWEVVESWPARAEIREQSVWILPAWSDTAPGAPTGALVDGEDGNLIDLVPGEDDTDPFNGYVVSTVPEGDEAAVVRLWTMPDGPMKWGGPYGHNPGFYSSPLNPTDPVKLLAIAERLTRRAVSTGQTLKFTARPDTQLSLGQVVTLRSSRRGVSGTGRVLSLELTRSALTGRVAVLS